MATMTMMRDTDSDNSNLVWCGHYKSGCKLIAKCCGQEFGCRFCHDNEHDTHIMNRYEVEEIVCNKCKMRQPISNSCKNEKCDNKIFAKYYCEICHLYSDSHIREIYHCDKCNICRICSLGNTKQDYFHCDRCGGCIISVMKETHKCIPDALKGDCCICLESIFLSKIPVKILPCGHVIHGNCLEEMFKNNKTLCPLCRKTILEGEVLKMFISQIDQVIASYPISSNINTGTGTGTGGDVLTKIKCNDCNFNDKVLYHPMGLKCGGCGGYNTIMDRSDDT
jgi:RING finger/CHY zinc finger protein 1